MHHTKNSLHSTYYEAVVSQNKPIYSEIGINRVCSFVVIGICCDYTGWLYFVPKTRRIGNVAFTSALTRPIAESLRPL